MRELKVIFCALLLCCVASIADAAKRSCPCNGGSCEVAAAKVAWPWTPTPKPPVVVVVPPVPVVVPACDPAEQLVVEVADRQGRHIVRAVIAVVVRAPAHIAKAVARIRPMRAVGKVLVVALPRHREKQPD